MGKSDHKIIAVYAASAEAYQDAVDYVRAETSGLPIWLLTARPVSEEVAAKCARVLRFPHNIWLPARVLIALWPVWVALNVVPFTRERGFFWLKLAPLLVPPWHLLVMNENRDFFSGSPAGLVVHAGRRARDRCGTWAETGKDLLLGIAWRIGHPSWFWRMAWAVLGPLLERATSAPWRQPPERPALADAEPQALEPGVLVWMGRMAPDRRFVEPALERLGLPYRVVDGPLPQSNYKYILAIEEAPAGDLRDLAALVERLDAFAAGFQSARAGFDNSILPQAPFRQLQPDETTAVVAPLPGVVLLDAGKLARLGGFPRTYSRRCGWMMLYWRAAGPPWMSYSVGAGLPHPPRIPGRAFAEAEFCWRLLRQRPQHLPDEGSFDARRGSVCFHPSYRSKLSAGRRRVLIVSPYLPFPLSHGGAVRIFNLARRLSERCDLLLLTFREKNDQVDYERLASCFARVMVVDHDERRRPDPSVPEAVAQFRSRAMAAAIREAAEQHRPDLLQIEYTQLAAYRDLLPQTKAVLVEHDVTFFLHEQLARTAPSRRNRREYERWYRYESHWLRRYDAIAVMSGEEKDRAVGAGAPAEQTWVVPNGVDTERFRPLGALVEGPPELLYVGSFRHRPNVIGFEHLRKEILPRLWQRFPELRLRVVAGPDYERHAPGGKADPRVQVEGFVENLAPYYARARVVLVPLTVSAGTNIKVMEALACGRPVVSTPIGCAGLELAAGEEILIAAGADAFADAVARLLEQPELWGSLARRSRQAAVERFSWERSAERAREMYEAVWASN